MVQQEKGNFVEVLRAAARRLELVRSFRHDAYSELAEALASVVVLQLELERDDEVTASIRQTLSFLARAVDIGKTRFEDRMTVMRFSEAALRLDQFDLVEQAITRFRAFASIPRRGEEPMLKRLSAFEAIYFEKTGSAEKADSAWHNSMQDAPVHLRQPPHLFLKLEYVNYLIVRE